MAAVNTQFSIAVHILTGLACKSANEATSGELAVDVKACPSFVRRVISKLSKANLVIATTGKSGCCVLARKPESITMLDIYDAVEAPKVFAIHDYPEHHECMASGKFKEAMKMVQETTQKSMEAGLKSMTLADVLLKMKSS